MSNTTASHSPTTPETSRREISGATGSQSTCRPRPCNTQGRRRGLKGKRPPKRTKTHRQTPSSKCPRSHLGRATSRPAHAVASACSQKRSAQSRFCFQIRAFSVCPSMVSFQQKSRTDGKRARREAARLPWPCVQYRILVALVCDSTLTAKSYIIEGQPDNCRFQVPLDFVSFRLSRFCVFCFSPVRP